MHFSREDAHVAAGICGELIFGEIVALLCRVGGSLALERNSEGGF